MLCEGREREYDDALGYSKSGIGQMKLTKNIDFSGRIIRLIIALLLLGLAYWRSSWVIFVLALFVLFEALMGWCALYQILGKNSCLTKRK